MLGTASTDAVNRAPRASYSEVTGITQTARNFGASLGLAVLGAILINRDDTNITGALIATASRRRRPSTSRRSFSSGRRRRVVGRRRPSPRSSTTSSSPSRTPPRRLLRHGRRDGRELPDRASLAASRAARASRGGDGAGRRRNASSLSRATGSYGGPSSRLGRGIPRWPSPPAGRRETTCVARDAGPPCKHAGLCRPSDRGTVGRAARRRPPPRSCSSSSPRCASSLPADAEAGSHARARLRLRIDPDAVDALRSSGY